MEIVIRAAAVFAILWALLRAMGKRELSEITAFELVLLVVFGDIVQQGVTQEDMSVTGAGLAASTMALLAVGSSALGKRSSRARRILDGRPSVILRNGELLEAEMRYQRISVDDVHEAARKRGLASLEHVAWVIVEADGKFSFIESEATDAGDDGGDQDDPAEGEPHA